MRVDTAACYRAGNQVSTAAKQCYSTNATLSRQARCMHKVEALSAHSKGLTAQLHVYRSLACNCPAQVMLQTSACVLVAPYPGLGLSRIRFSTEVTMRPPHTSALDSACLAVASLASSAAISCCMPDRLLP